MRLGSRNFSHTTEFYKKQNRKQNKTKLSLKTTAAKAQKKATKAGGLKKNKQQPNKKQPNNSLNCKEGLYSLEAEILS